jgi:MFS family permease
LGAEQDLVGGETDPGGAAGPAFWVQPLLATLLVQATAAYLTRIIPTIAPAVGPEFGWTDRTIGYLAAATTLGSIVFLIIGSPLIRQTGPIRALQIGLALGLFGLALLPVPAMVATVIACLLIGLGYAPSSPAGTDILQRHAPAAHRNLIFSL